MSEAVKTRYEGIDYPTPLDIDWLLEKNLPVFVRNLSRPRGTLMVHFTQSNGHVKGVKIHRTALPINLSSRLSKETLGSSDDLRQCIMKGMLEVVRPDLAEIELSDPENAHEIQTLQLSDFSSRNQFMSGRVQDMQKTADNKIDANAPSLEPLGVETSVLNPRVMSMVEKLKNGDMSIKAAVTELKILEPELKDTDCANLITNGPDGQIKTFVQKILAKIRGTAVKASSVEDVEPVLTPEEQAAEAQREAAARAHQRV